MSKDTNLFLASEDAKKSLDRVSGTVLIDRLRKLGVAHGLPRLAFLATCESASPKAEAEGHWADWPSAWYGNWACRRWWQ